MKLIRAFCSNALNRLGSPRPSEVPPHHPMIHEGVRAYNRTRASRRQPRMPHAQCTDELNHRTQAPPAQTGRDLNPFARITRVSAIAPNLVRVIRRSHPAEVTGDKRRSPTAGAVSQAPRERRGLSVVKCLCACLVVRGAHLRGMRLDDCAEQFRPPPRARRPSITDELARTARDSNRAAFSVPGVPSAPRDGVEMRAAALMSPG